MTEVEASLYEAPFNWVVREVAPVRAKSNNALERRLWWLLARRAPALRHIIRDFNRIIVTPELSKHRIFRWYETSIVFDKNVIVIARDDDTSFGILHSRFHTL